MSRRINLSVFLAALLLLISVRICSASTITIRENLSGNNPFLTAYFGQSVVTTAGGPWNNIAFNFFGSSGALASGQIYILTSEYLSTPSALSSSTTGYIGQAAATGGTSYIFDTSITLAANTQYWFYTDSAVSGVLGGASSGVTGEGHYATLGADENFAGPYIGVNFRLTGTVVPLPAALPLFGTALGLLGLFGWFRRRRVQAV